MTYVIVLAIVLAIIVLVVVFYRQRRQDRDTYPCQARCGNCNARSLVRIPKGVSIDTYFKTVACPHCGLTNDRVKRVTGTYDKKVLCTNCWQEAQIKVPKGEFAHHHAAAIACPNCGTNKGLGLV